MNHVEILCRTLRRSFVSPAAASSCKSFSGMATGLTKSWAVWNAQGALNVVIGKYKEAKKLPYRTSREAEKPPIHPFWRESVSEDLFLRPDVVTDTDHTICWEGVVSPVVCTSGAKLCW